MIIEEYDLIEQKEEWNLFIENSINSNMYQLGEFIDINSYKCDKIKNLVFKQEDKIIASISIGIIGKGVAKPPFSSSFAGFNYHNDISLMQLKNVVETFKRYCTDNDIEIIEICQPPLIYLKHLDEKIDYALLSNDFILEGYEVCLYKETNELSYNIRSNLKRNIKKAESSQLKFKKINNADECFYFINNQKKIQSIPFSIEFNDFNKLNEAYPEKVQMYGVYRHDLLIAAIIMYVINEKTVLGFNWAQDKKYQEFRPSDYLLYKAIEVSYDNGFEFFDFGTTTLNGIINKGVTDFKEKFNPSAVLRKKYKYMKK